MPNWVTNTVSTDIKHFPKLMSLLLNDDGDVDFQRVVPLSEDLNISSGCGYKVISAPYHASLYADDLKFQSEHVDNFLKQFYNDNITQDEFVKIASDKLKEDKEVLSAWVEKYGEYKYYKIPELSSKDFGEDVIYPVIIAGYFNTQRYGHPDWYDANISKWGTKWNAHETELFEQCNIIMFKTAWSSPIPILEKLSLEMPVYLAYADEDIGSNFGLVKFENGIPHDMLDDFYFEYDRTLDRKKRKKFMVDIIVAYAISGYDYEATYSMFEDETWYDGEWFKNYYPRGRKACLKLIEDIYDNLISKLVPYILI